ncbi:TerB N-terminal domain-containing protein [Dactylosporangium sp. NPDC048998]|uniref:tellurite resistance TerB family protein n=1 Tax=Dactylosporangium sp. NPDC048998 TaxID=3363976 RepID=UPI0037111CBE
MGQRGGEWDGARADRRSATAPAAPRPVLHAVGPQAVWVPPGQILDVAGHRIPGGMFYTGRGLHDAHGGTEPALIDPGLPIDPARPDWDGGSLPYWPSYTQILPGARAAYLAWLADGRRYAQAPIGYVFLYFYGLERRVLSDLQHDGTVRYELATIAAEVRRLLGVYGENRSFRTYATDFLAVLDLIGDGSGTVAVPDEPPPAAGDCWSPPITLRLGLGCFARDGEPVPVEWARTWAWFHPAIYARTPQERCPDEFRELFAIRYAQRFGDGIAISSGSRQLTVGYRPASAGIGDMTLRMQVPDVLEEPAVSARLRDLVGSVTDDLDAYSRWVGRHPDKRGSLAEAALLPMELLAGRTGQVDPLRRWCEENLERGLVDATDLIRFWETATPHKATKAESVGLVQLLGRLGFGIEPDVRMGGAPLSAGPAVLFQCGPDAPTSARPPYLAVTLLLHLAVAVGLADGEVSAVEQEHLVGHVRHAFQLTAAEMDRLAAHIRWLTATGVKLTGLKRRLAGLTTAAKRDIADFAVSVAAVDGVVSPAEVTTLTKIYKLLDLDGGDVFGRLHDAVSGPVVVRERVTVDDEYRLPPRPAGQPARAGFALDDAAIAAKLADTASVSALLATIFVDDDPQADAVPAATPQPAAEPVVVGLDAAHSRMVRLLAAKPSWSRPEFDRLAAGCGLLPAGALDVLNEAALDRLGDTVVDGDETLHVNTEILEGLLG